MNCVTCSGPVQHTLHGDWCDACGGVSFKPGQLFFRHVATVEGAGGRFPIVFDLSGNDYAASYPKPPGTLAMPILADADLGFRPSGVFTVRGTLDAVIAIMQPVARGDSLEMPELSAAPSATDEEKVLIGA